MNRFLFQNPNYSIDMMHEINGMDDILELTLVAAALEEDEISTN